MLRRTVLRTAAMLLCPFGVVSAQEQEGAFDRLWRFAEWYESDTNPVVQDLLLSGRYQHDYSRVADAGVTYDEWNVRRFRLGLRLNFLRRLRLHFEADFNPQEADPFYQRLTDAYLRWTAGESVYVTAGKQSAPFTMDGATSSKELLTIDRNNLSNNMWFTREYMPGVSASGEIGRWVYRAGVYSAGDVNGEFGDFEGSAFTLAVLGYDFGDALGVDEALVRANYVFQDEDPDNTATRRLDHIGSLNLKLEADGWGLRTDFSAGSGYQGQSDLWGSMVMPYYNLTDELQLIGRYTFVKSHGVNGVRLARYESQHTSGRGDRYRELYLGANYFLYGHELKLQGGIQLAEMKDRALDGGAYSGVSGTMGFRISW